MPSRTAQIDGLLAQLDAFRAEDISHSELGTTSGFHQAEEAKNELCDYLIEILVIARGVEEYVNTAVFDQGLEQVRAEAQALSSIAREIARISKDDLHTPQFPSNRAGQIDSLQNRVRHTKLALHPFETALHLARVETGVLSPSRADALNDEINRLRAQLASTTAEAAKVLDNLRDRVMKKGVAEAVANFASLRMHHALQARRWFIAFIAASLAALAAVAYVVFAPWAPTTPATLIAAVVRKLLAISTPAVFMQVALRKYNLERNLQIIYDHRETVLAQYRNFESAIGDDAAAKNQFRLEIAKYIFSDPVTGYVSASTASEITINPVIGLVERAMSSAGKGAA